MSAIWTWCRRHRLGLAGWLAVAVFAVLAGRFWHPAYGFTKLLQFDESAQRRAIRELRALPVYIYPDHNGYDGSAYAQIAFHPLLESPDLKRAVDNLSYRARRILGSALAWVLAGGKAERIPQAAAMLNLGVWLVFAGLLWRLLPVNDGRSWVAWAGLLFSAGALHAVRFALTDLLAVTLLAAAMLLAERRRPWAALVVLALAGLARETALAGVVALWHGPWHTGRAWRANLGRTLAVALPLAGWMAYVRWKVGPADQGLDNFTWPLEGLVEKWAVTLAGFSLEPDHWWLTAATLLATAGLMVQAVFLVRRPQADEAWWRVGATAVVLMLLLGTAVWEGHPGAASRILLPMGLAFAVLAVRQRAGLAWLIAGSLSVGSGVLAMWHVPQDGRELAAGRTDRGAHVVRLDAGWYGVEHNRDHVWTWSDGRGQLALQTWPRTGASRKARLGLRSLVPCMVEIRQGSTRLWRGPVGLKLQPVELAGWRGDGSPLQLIMDERPVRPEGGADPRALGFAVYDLRIE